MATTTARRQHTPFAQVPTEVKPIYPTPWPALLVTREETEAEIERLADLDCRANARRASEMVHPSSPPSLPSIAPGLSITVNVVRPGESISYYRDNATRVEFILSGEGVAVVGSRTLQLVKWSVCSMPSMTRREYRNLGNVPLVWLSYSNVPLLERLGIHFSDSVEPRPLPPLAERSEIEKQFVAKGAPDYPILSDGARLRGYEFTTDIAVVENRPLVWPWAETSQHLCLESGDGKRGLLVLYNPATGRRQGTTHSFFAALSRSGRGPRRPVPPRGHKHSSFACNYHFEGAGESVIDGEHFEWQAGDLMFSAPSWAEHAHGKNAGGASILTVQDHPFQMAIESLIWQEKMDGTILTLGSEPGQTGYVGPRLAGDAVTQ